MATQAELDAEAAARTAGDAAGGVPTDGSVTNAKVAAGAAIAESKLALASDAAANVASRRTLGNTALQAMPGNTALHALSSAAPIALGTAEAGAGAAASREDHVHPTTGLVKTSGTQTVTGPSTLLASAIAVIPLVAKGMAGQTADLQQWQNSAGTVLSKVGSTGGAFFQRSDSGVPLIVKRDSGASGSVLQEWQNQVGTPLVSMGFDGTRIGSSVGGSSVLSTNAVDFGPSYVPIVAKGAAGQSADLQQWQNSAGTVLARVNASGNVGIGTTTPQQKLVVSGGANGFEFTPGATGATSAVDVFDRVASSFGSLTVRSSLAFISHQAPANIALLVRGAPSQTADLQQWQSAAAVVYKRINKDGFDIIKKTAAPADADLAASELAYWLDDTVGATKAMFKAKDSAGTVRIGSLLLT